MIQAASDYSNVHDASYQRKLDQVALDIKGGLIDRLTLKIGRDRYQMRDSRTRQVQVDLCKLGLLVRQGQRFRVAA